MSLCPHGYTANWDCPECLCWCGSGLPTDECHCHSEADDMASHADAASDAARDQEYFGL